MEHDHYIELHRIYVGVRTNCNIFLKKDWEIESISRFPQGSVTVYGMNLLSKGVNVTFPQFEGQLKIYLLSAPNQNLKSR